MEPKNQKASIRDMIYHVCKRDYAKAHKALTETVVAKNQVRYDQIEQKIVSETNK
jgi:hypothetical protein